MNKKKALVTGASSGIGRVFARELTTKNYTVTGVARNEEKLKATFQDLDEGHHYIVADLTKPEQLANIEKEISNTKYQLLVNNAGYAVYDRFEKVPLERYENLMYLNMSSLVRLSYAFLKTATVDDALINVSPLEIGLMSVIVFAGSSQFIAVSMLAAGASMVSIVATTFVVNLRHFLMSSALAVYLKNANRKKLTFSLRAPAGICQDHA